MQSCQQAHNTAKAEKTLDFFKNKQKTIRLYLKIRKFFYEGTPGHVFGI